MELKSTLELNNEVHVKYDSGYDSDYGEAEKSGVQGVGKKEKIPISLKLYISSVFFHFLLLFSNSQNLFRVLRNKQN